MHRICRYLCDFLYFSGCELARLTCGRPTVLQAIRREAPRLGGSFAVWGGLFSTFDCSLVAIRKKVEGRHLQSAEGEPACCRRCRQHSTSQVCAGRPLECYLGRSTHRRVFALAYGLEICCKVCCFWRRPAGKHLYTLIELDCQEMVKYCRVASSQYHTNT